MRIFKNLILFFCVALAFSSCSDDDSSNDEKSIAGTWEITELTQDDGQFEGDISDVDLPTAINFKGKGKNYENALITLNEDNTYKSSGSFVNEITVNLLLSEQKFDLPINLTNFISGTTWSKSGNKITVDNGEEKVELTIVESTDSTLKIEFFSEQEIDLERIKGKAKATTKINLTKKTN